MLISERYFDSCRRDLSRSPSWQNDGLSQSYYVCLLGTGGKLVSASAELPQILRCSPGSSDGIYRPQALNLCMSRESYKTSKSNLGNWKRMEGGNWSCNFKFGGPVLNWNCMKLDEVGTSRESCPSSSFRRFDPRLLRQGVLSGFFGGLFGFLVGEGKGEVWHLPG